MLHMQKGARFQEKNIGVIRVNLLESQLMELKRISIETVISVSNYNIIMLWLKILTLILLLLFVIPENVVCLKTFLHC